jgi:hypothetical protein
MFDSLNDKQMRDRVRFLSDKIEDIWKKVEPDLMEFDELRVELVQLLDELTKRESPDVKT